jgi:enoyl-CoA hydratase
MQFETFSVTLEGRLLTIAFNRPDAMNAVNLRLHEELAEVFIWAEQDPDSDVVVITGEGKAFSAGGDFSHIQNLAANPDLFDEEIRLAQKIIYSMLAMQKPLICRLNGHAVGLGATVALFCDVIYAAEHAKIGDPHVAVGLTAGDGGAIIWPYLIGVARAKEFLLSGKLLTAIDAAAIGLINKAVPFEQLDSLVSEYCQGLLDGPQLAIRNTKMLLNQELIAKVDMLLEKGLRLEKATLASADHREALAAIVEKRKPKFSAR